MGLSTSGFPVGTPAYTRKVVGLDSIRFVCAFVVMLGHIGLLNDRLYGSARVGFAHLATGIYNALFNGPAAVIVFFIISGFCIHFPFRGTRALSRSSFYSRRFIRIVLPAAAFLLILRYVLRDNSSPQNTVLWSVICEMIYYLIYPALLYFRRRSSWLILIAFASSAAAIIIAMHVGSLNAGLYGYIALGWSTWIVGLPCWLFGCWLAENYQSFAVLSTAQIWLLRAAIYSLTVLLELFRFHVNSFFLASNCILLDLFAVPACFWLGYEISYASHHARSRVLEWAGGWSYSLYLVHPLVGPALSAIGLSLIVERPQTHFLLLILSLFASYGFFLLVERPSHRLAVAIAAAMETNHFLSQDQVARVGD